MVAVSTLILLLSAPQQNSGPHIVGNGNIVTETRQLSSFDRLEVSNGYDIEVRVGGPLSFKVEAESNVQKYLISTVNGRTCKLTVEHGVNLTTHKSMKAYITVPSLQELKILAGVSGKIRLTNAKSFKLEATGGCEAEVSGKVENFLLKSMGGSNITLNFESGVAIGADVTGGCDVKASGMAKSVAIKGIGGCSIDFSKLRVAGPYKIYLNGASSARVRPGSRVSARIEGASDLQGLSGSYSGSVISGDKDDDDDN